MKSKYYILVTVILFIIMALLGCRSKTPIITDSSNISSTNSSEENPIISSQSVSEISKQSSSSKAISSSVSSSKPVVSSTQSQKQNITGLDKVESAIREALKK